MQVTSLHAIRQVAPCHAARVLQLAGITKSFGARAALSGVALEVAAGELVVLAGRNGAGKTTLLRIATGFLDPDAGSVTLDGISLLGSPRDRARAQRALGYMPETAPAPPELSVRAHLVLRAHLKRVREVRAAVDRVMAAAAIASEADRRIGALSKGYRQRVGLADALLGDPRLLVLDEPLSGLDPIQMRELCDQLDRIAKTDGRAVLVSSHVLDDLLRRATRTIALHEGKLADISVVTEVAT
jgi:ABC-type multidrug transport system ATPase subunit